MSEYENKLDILVKQIINKSLSDNENLSFNSLIDCKNPNKEDLKIIKDLSGNTQKLNKNNFQNFVNIICSILVQTDEIKLIVFLFDCIFLLFNNIVEENINGMILKKIRVCISTKNAKKLNTLFPLIFKLFGKINKEHKEIEDIIKRILNESHYLLTVPNDEESFILCKVYSAALCQLISFLELKSVLYFSRILPLIFKFSEFDDFGVNINSLDAINEILVKCKPRVKYHMGNILKSLFTLVRKIRSEHFKKLDKNKKREFEQKIVLVLVNLKENDSETFNGYIEILKENDEFSDFLNWSNF